MEELTVTSEVQQPLFAAGGEGIAIRARPKQRLLFRIGKWVSIGGIALVALSAIVLQDDVRTLNSLRRVPETNLYVMDYYAPYNLDEFRRNGMDVHNIEDSCLTAYFPDFVVPIARAVKRSYLPKAIKTVEDSGHFCSTVALRTQEGSVYFGRNFDYNNDASLIVRIHDSRGVASISVIDLAYLNLNRPDLDKTDLLTRIPLLFAPYYVMDGMNRHGLAVSMMAVPHAEPPIKKDTPAIIEPTLMRLMLDYCQTTNEAIELARQYNVHFVEAPLHLLIADAAGTLRIIEYVDHEMRVTQPDEPWQICTNDIICNKTENDKDASCLRYRAGSELAEQIRDRGSIAEVRNIVKSMSQHSTMWSSIYNLTTKEAYISYRGKFGKEHQDRLRGD